MSKEVESMVYDLVIEVDYRSPKQFKKLLENNEIPNGLEIILNIKMTNIGKKIFPGGVLKELSINYESAVGGGLKTINTISSLIKPLSPGKKITIYKWETTFKQPGLAWVRCVINPKNDKDKIQFYQNKEHKEIESMKQWQNVFLIIDRTNLEIMRKLENIAGKLDKLVRKGN